jgi:class 3 adenylate cyclase
LTQAPVESGPRGDAASTAPASVDERLDVERAKTRLRFGVAAGLAVSSHGGGLGLGLDLGVVLSDRYAVYVRGSLDYFFITGMAFFP